MPAAQQAAFDFIERISTMTDPDQVVSTLHRTGDIFGFENFCISGLPMPGESLDPYVLVSGWPGGWMQRYAGRGYVHVDPVIRRVRESSLPFLWSEAPLGTDERAVRVMDEATEFGLVEGFAVPIFTTHGFQAIVTFGARELSLSADQRAALHLVAIYAHAQARLLAPGRASNPRRKRPPLSVREIECLKWSADGKSTWEISVILSLSEKTVEQYLSRAAAKLGAANRVQCVAEAMRAKLIQ